MWTAAEEWLRARNPLRLFDLAGSLASEPQLRRLIGGVTGLLAGELPAKHRRDAVAAADAIAGGETRTAAVTRLRAEVSRGTKLPPRVRRVLSFVVGGLNEDLRLAARTRLGEVLSHPPVCKMCDVEAAMRCVLGNPFRPVVFAPAWRTSDVALLARGMGDARDYSAMPILADALQDAGCDSDDLLSHCRDATLLHVRGCWVIDLVVGKN